MKSSAWKFAAVLLLCRFAAAIPPAELESAIGHRLSRVEEFRFLKEQADILGVKVYLFGGTAAAFAHYVNWDLAREHGDSRFDKRRFDYDYTNIFRSTQDLDLVVDGPAELARALKERLERKYPYLVGTKTQWEVRLLREKYEDKDPLLDSYDFLNQNSDSSSTGLILVTSPQAGEKVVRDLRDWTSDPPIFLEDVRLGTLHYYFSPTHETTSRAKDGLNPPILSAIRYLTKAFQYELEVTKDDMRRVHEVIEAFDPKRDAANSYVKSWIERNGKKLLQHAVSVEYASRILDETGLKAKLLEMGGDPAHVETLAWWLNKEPLRAKPFGTSGRTAAELGLSVVAHETKDFLAYEAITRSPRNEPNVFISREGFPGEAAAHGDGFYTLKGKKGARGTGFTIRFEVDPRAREGHDFSIVDDIVIFKNKSALKVIPESLDLTPLELLRWLENFEESERGLMEKLVRRAGRKLGALDGDELSEALSIVRRAAAKPLNARRDLGPTLVLKLWLSSPVSRKHPEILSTLMVESNLQGESARTMAEHFLTLDTVIADPRWPDWVDAVIQDGSADNELFARALNSPAVIRHPAWPSFLKALLTTDGNVLLHHAEILAERKSLEEMGHHRFMPGWFEAAVERIAEKRATRIVKELLSLPLARRQIGWEEVFDSIVRLDTGKRVSHHHYRAMDVILTQPDVARHPRWPEWVDRYIRSGDASLVGQAAASFFEMERFQTDPHVEEWVEIFTHNPSAQGFLLGRMYHGWGWDMHPLLERWIFNIIDTVPLDESRCSLVTRVLERDVARRHPRWGDWVDRFLRRSVGFVQTTRSLLTLPEAIKDPRYTYWLEAAIPSGLCDDLLSGFLIPMFDYHERAPLWRNALRLPHGEARQKFLADHSCLDMLKRLGGA